ncbi:magnesium transporter [Megalodesulfovibrio paquesii]
MKESILISNIQDLIARNDVEALRGVCRAEHPGAVAECLAALSPAEIWQVIRHAPPALQAEIASHLPEEVQAAFIMSLTRQDTATLLTAMSPDDRAALFRNLTEEQRQAVFPALALAEREDIRRLTAYPKGSAGAVMTSDYVALRANMTAGQALAQLRLEAPKKEIIYYAYVLDDARRLIGFVSLKDLILARPEASIEQFMHREVLFARVEDDQEAAARIIQKYDLIALPVVNGGDALVGIITHDDALDVITQEHQEDVEKLMAIRGSHQAGAYLKTSSWVHFKNRATWIVGLAALGLVSGMIIHSFEDSLMQLLILALYMPMVADTGGNTGSQSATVVVRALALGEITPRDAWRVLFKELQISVLLALILGLLSWGKVLFLSQGTELPPGYALGTVGAAIAIALALQVVTATLIGAVLPLGASKLKMDPAVVASPALTTVVDITGLLLYFTTAKLLLGI